MTSTAIDLLIAPRPRDLGDGFMVRRVLPYMKRRMVGPFVFFDHMGPNIFAPGEGLDVRPHPHIGLATVTYLFEGAIMHRDSLGYALAIEPGAVNWMTAGRGIVHSERTGDTLRAAGHKLAGIQSWVALPKHMEETEPTFVHHPAHTLPKKEMDGITLTGIAGTGFGMESPVAVASPTLYVDAVMPEGTSLTVPAEHTARAVYLAEGAATLDGTALEPYTMAVLAEGAEPVLRATADSRAMILGGAPMDGPRTIWWNFVSSDPARIKQAKDDWTAGRFAKVPGETEFIPLPEG